MTTISEAYGMRPPRAFKFGTAVDCINPELLLGVELETEQCTLGAGRYDELLSSLGISVKEDGSLRAVNGLRAYEFITKPTASKHLLPLLTEYFRRTAFNDENFSDRTSVHVHANCTDLTFEQVSNVCLLYTVVEPIIFQFINDKPGHKDNWSRDTNLYCVPWNQCRDHYNLVRQLLEEPGEITARWQKYTALNVAPLARFGTLEFRHMHGTANMDKLTKWINIIGAMFLYATKTSMDELTKEIIGLNTVSHYEKFFNTVLGKQLVYNEEYRGLLEEGTILAKYSMSTWADKQVGVVSKKTEVDELLGGAPEATGLGGIAGFDDFDFVQQERVLAQREVPLPPRNAPPTIRRADPVAARARDWQDVLREQGNIPNVWDAPVPRQTVAARTPRRAGNNAGAWARLADAQRIAVENDALRRLVADEPRF